MEGWRGGQLMGEPNKIIGLREWKIVDMTILS
jgi:hypothetical protein